MRPSLMPRLPVRIPTLTGPPHPPAPYLSQSDSIDLLTEFLEEGKGKTCVLTGAGVSVDSGIRAYRGKNGSYTHNKKHRPIFYHEFVEEESKRRRYWARSYLGYPPVRTSEPNPIHYALSSLQKMGHVSHLITQNVDGLHHKAHDSDLTAYLSPSPTSPSSEPTSSILELHGTLRHAHCLSCDTPVGRDAMQDRLSQLNPAWSKYADEVTEGREERLNPDGDVELGPGVKYEDFVVPPCDKCGGPMKPRVTFFGESLSPYVRQLSEDWLSSSTQLLIIGSSLATFSAFRLVRSATDSSKPVGLLNVGESRGDPLATWRIGWEGGAGDIVPGAVRKLLEKGGVEDGLRKEVEEMLRKGVVKRVKGGPSTT